MQIFYVRFVFKIMPLSNVWIGLKFNPKPKPDLNECARAISLEKCNLFVSDIQYIQNQTVSLNLSLHNEL
jgi:hypothetical protein